MRRLASIPLALLCISAGPRPGEPAPKAQPGPAPQNFGHDMNVMRTRADCTPIPRQVSGEDRRYDGTRLDQQPPGRLMLAVQREVNGCPEATLVSDRTYPPAPQR